MDKDQIDNTGHKIDSLGKPTIHSFQVYNERIWACEYPFDLNEEIGKAKLQGALDFGITHFIDLTEEGELYPYSHLISAESKVEHHRFAIPDTWVPASFSDVMDLMKKMNEILTNPDSKIYLHCWGGVGRTGTIVGCWIAWRHSLGYEETIRELRTLWKNCPKSKLREIPDTCEQVEFIDGFIQYIKQ